MINKNFGCFTFLVRDVNSKLRRLHFNTLTGSLIDKDSLNVLVKGQPIEKAPLKKPKTLSIVLGVKCNLHCSYCIQTNIRERVNIDFTPKDINGFIKKLSKIDLSDLSRIIFWGGEPLVYWKTLIKLIPKLKIIYPQVKEFFISTNGTLLTKDKLDFLLQNDVKIQLSDDIFNTERKTDLNKTRELIAWAVNKYPTSTIRTHTVISNTNPDAYKILSKATEIFPKIDSLRCSPVSPPLSFEFWNSTAGNFNTQEALLFEASLFKFFTEKSNNFLKNSKINLLLRNNFFNGYACAFANELEICVDVKGNQYACRGSFEKSNIVNNLDTFKYPLKDPRFLKYLTRPLCRNCPLLRYCRGICSQLPDKLIHKYCLSHYAYHRANLRIALKLLFNFDLISIVNVDQDKIFQHNISYENLSDVSRFNSKIIPITLVR